MYTRIVKADNDQQLVYAEVYAPNVLDSQGHFMEPDEVIKMAHRFISENKQGMVDVNHDESTIDANVVESFVARKNDPDFLEGAWVVGVHIRDSKVWEDVKNNRINGFSLQGVGKAHIVEAEIEVPSELSGKTQLSKNHEHTFTVKLKEDGTIESGYTDEVDGHRHVITSGTITEQSEGHAHRYSFLDEIMRHAQIESQEAN